VDISHGDGAVARGRLLLNDRSPTSNALLDAALDQIAAKQGKTAKDVVRTLAKNIRAPLYERLAERGLLHEETANVLGVFRSHRWPSRDTTHEDAVRELLAGALRAGSTANPHVAALVSLLRALKSIAKVVDPAGLGITKRELNANARRIAAGDWASEAVRKAIDEMLAAIIAATSSSAVVSSGGG
jgi:Golgi phosphoprotein 3 GPP34